MRGGAQSQLMLGADDDLWVVKFRNNPQGSRVLANELIATRLASLLNLQVPRVEIVEVSSWLIANTPEMWVDVGKGNRAPCEAGLAFGSQYVGGLMPGQVVDYLPEEQLRDLKNLEQFAGMLCLDKWTGNSNGRQAVFSRKPKERKYRATFIDQGYCFQATEWKFSDSPLRGVYPSNQVYESITGWKHFEPWLTMIEEFSLEMLWSVAEDIPQEWYGDPYDLEQLLERLHSRRSRVRELVQEFRESMRQPFPHWGKSHLDLSRAAFPISGPEAKFVM